jgi:hypothetical protein
MHATDYAGQGYSHTDNLPGESYAEVWTKEQEA